MIRAYVKKIILRFLSDFSQLFYIIFICNLILFQFSFSQDNINFKLLSIEHGLSQSTINCFFQDSKGFMWIGTQDGLNKFDGYNFEVFKHHPLDSNTISHNWIIDVFEDKNGHIWIATWYGLNKYDPKSAKIIRYFAIIKKITRDTIICFIYNIIRNNIII